MKVIAYYTLSYKEQAKRLVSSLMKYSLDFYVKIYEDRETWAQNCQIKPEFILECLETFDEDLLFVDADAEFVRQPPMDYLSGENLGVYILAWRNPDNPEHLEQELISATIWIPNNPQNKRLIKKSLPFK